MTRFGKIRWCKKMNLSELPVNKKAVIKKIGSSGTLRRRMIDMGITPGTLVKVVKYAPLGDPIQINIHGYDLSIRKSEAEAIQLFDSESDAEKYLKDSLSSYRRQKNSSFSKFSCKRFRQKRLYSSINRQSQ